jgi:hypothetical protein
MKPFATFAAALLLGTGVTLASTSFAMPLSASATPQGAAALPIQTAQHPQSHVARRHIVRPSDPYGSYGAYNYAPGHGADDWSQWSPANHPGWPCVSGSGDETSAYPSWEVRPNCR